MRDREAEEEQEKRRQKEQEARELKRDERQEILATIVRKISASTARGKGHWTKECPKKPKRKRAPHSRVGGTRGS